MIRPILTVFCACADVASSNAAAAPASRRIGVCMAILPDLSGSLTRMGFTPARMLLRPPSPVHAHILSRASRRIGGMGDRPKKPPPRDWQPRFIGLPRRRYGFLLLLC